MLPISEEDIVECLATLPSHFTPEKMSSPPYSLGVSADPNSDGDRLKKQMLLSPAAYGNLLLHCPAHNLNSLLNKSLGIKGNRC